MPSTVSLPRPPKRPATRHVSTAGDVLQSHLSASHHRIVIPPKRDLPKLLCAPEVNQVRLTFDTAGAVRSEKICRIVHAHHNMTVWSVEGCRHRGHGFYDSAPDPAMDNAIRLVMTFIEDQVCGQSSVRCLTKLKT